MPQVPMPIIEGAPYDFQKLYEVTKARHFGISGCGTWGLGITGIGGLGERSVGFRGFRGVSCRIFLVGARFCSQPSFSP